LPGGSRGELIDLMGWTGGRLLLLVFGDLTAAGAQRLRTIGGAGRPALRAGGCGRHHRSDVETRHC
jgi:hypothetical protein